MNENRTDAVDSLKPARSRVWLRDVEFGLLLVLLLAIYGTRVTQPTIRGEESRRARVAVEMIESGDWVVPRLQGRPFLSRPPLQNWAIALVGLARGTVDEVAVRLPSILATVLIACLIYGYARSFMSAAAALLAAASYASLGQVLELGRLGETEALFTLFVSGSLLVWHWTDCRGWPRSASWCPAYALVALGTLTKGPQAPIYFASTIGLYLVLSRRRRLVVESDRDNDVSSQQRLENSNGPVMGRHRQSVLQSDRDRLQPGPGWRKSIQKLVICHRWGELFSRPHLLGVLTFLTIWMAWQIPFFYQLGWRAVEHIYVSDVTFRFEDSGVATFTWHLFRFPAEILFGCLLPWSALLIPLGFPGFWRTLGPARDHAVFLLCCLAVTFPTCWLVPGAVGRYYMPLYPCIAVLIGLAAERCWLSDRSRDWQKAWSRFLIAVSGLMWIVPLSVLSISIAVSTNLLDADNPLYKVRQPVLFGVIYLAAGLCLAIVTIRSRTAEDSVHRSRGVLAVTAFLGMTYVGFYLNCLANSSNDTGAQVAAVKRRLPRDTQLFSLGRGDHQFAFHFRDPIVYQPWPKSTNELPDGFRFFCFKPDKLPGPLPFGWEQVALVTCDRNRKKHSEHQVIVARFLADKIAARSTRRQRR